MAIPSKPQRSVIHHLCAPCNQSHTTLQKQMRGHQVRGPDFKFWRGVRTKAQFSAWDCSIMNSLLTWIQEQSTMVRKWQDCQIRLCRTWRMHPWGDINHRKTQLERWNTNLRNIQCQQKVLLMGYSVILVEDGWLFCLISFICLWIPAVCIIIQELSASEAFIH